MRRILSIAAAFLLLSAAEGRAQNPEPRFYAGIEVAELLQNRFRDLGPANYAILAGQRLGGERSKWGWRVMSVNVDLAEEHLTDPMTVCCIEGNREGLQGSLGLHRLYVDYYITDLRWRFLRFTPVVGAGVGYQYETVVNTRLDESWSFDTFAVALFPRLQFSFFDRVFIEYPALDLSVHPRRPQAEIGDVRLTKPEHFSIHGLLPLAIEFRL